jgi:hypothetical protein
VLLAALGSGVAVSGDGPSPVILSTLRSFASDSHPLVRGEALRGLLRCQRAQGGELGVEVYSLAVEAADDDFEVRRHCDAHPFST